MSAGAFVLFGVADSLWLLVLSRVVQGAGGGTVAVVQAYVADAVPPEQRAKALGWLSAATSLGVALGPVLGSLSVQLGEIDLLPADGVQGLGRTAPGVVAALLCVVNAAYAWRSLAESRARQTTKQPAGASPFFAVKRVLAQPRLPASRLLFTYAIAIGAAQGVNWVVVLYLKRRFGFDAATIGLYFTYTAELAVISRTQLLGPLVDRFGEARLSRIGITTLAAGLGLLPFAASLPVLALVAALLPVGMALTFPCLTALLSRVVSADERGLWMGLQQTFGGAMRLLAPLAYGWAWDELGPAEPFWLAGGVVLATLVFGTGVATPPRRAAA
jgi:MFS family permease